MPERQRRAASEMFEHLQELAEDVFGDGDDSAQERENYVTEHMKRMGYKMRVVFEDRDDDDNSGRGDSFTGSIFGAQRRERRDVAPRDRSRRASGDYR